MRYFENYSDYYPSTGSKYVCLTRMTVHTKNSRTMT